MYLQLTLLFRILRKRCSVKEAFSEISQNSQENTCARVSFLIKLQASGSISNNLEQFIRSHLALDQRKKISAYRISLSEIFAYVEQIFRSYEQFPLVISNFSQNFQNFSCNFFSQISLFSKPAGTNAAIVPVRMSKDSQIKRFGSIYFSLEYSIKEV